MKRMEDRADVESAESEGWRTWVEFNVARQKNKQKKKNTAEAKVVWSSKQQEDDSPLTNDNRGLLNVAKQLTREKTR